MVHNDDSKEIINMDRCDKHYRLLLFYDSECDHCWQLLATLRTWYAVRSNSAQLDIVSVSLDHTREAWEPAFKANAFP